MEKKGLLLVLLSQDEEGMSVVHEIRSGVKRKCSDHDDTLSRSGLESKSSPHKSLFLIHAIFTSVVWELLMNLVILSNEVSTWALVK